MAIAKKSGRRNLEAGVAIEDRSFLASVERQWLHLAEADVVVRGT